MKKVLVWFLALRPLSFLASMAPVMMGIALAYADGFSHWPSAFFSVLVMLFVHTGTNLANDYYDYISGVDMPSLGRPDGILVSKKLTLGEVKWGFIIAFTLAVFFASFLVVRLGLAAVVILVVSLMAGFFYTAGKWSLSRLGLGDIVVLFFFGPVACAGTYFAISYEFNMSVAVAGLMPGFLSTGVLVINNLRDIVSDRRAGRLTWAVRFGKGFTRLEYIVCVLASSAVPVYYYYMTNARGLVLLCAAMVFLAAPLIMDVAASDDPKILNRALGLTSVYLFIQALVFSGLCLQ